MGNHLGPLPEASNGPQGQEPPVCAVGGQGELREVTELLCKLDTRFFLNHRFVGMGNHLGSLSEASGGPEGQEPPVWAVGYHFHGSSVRGGGVIFSNVENHKICLLTPMFLYSGGTNWICRPQMGSLIAIQS